MIVLCSKRFIDYQFKPGLNGLKILVQGSLVVVLVIKFHQKLTQIHCFRLAVYL